MKRALRIAVVLGALAAGATASVLAARAPLSMLDELESGRWELRMRDGSPAERVCLQGGRRLIQLRHPAAACESLVVNDAASEVVVQYTCRGRGYGRTRVLRETNRLVQIDSQGIADGLPFAFVAEARRVGDCTG